MLKLMLGDNNSRFVIDALSGNESRMLEYFVEDRRCRYAVAVVGILSSSVHGSSISRTRYR